MADKRNTKEAQEKRLREILSKANRKTFIGECIHAALESGKPSFGKLITELKEQQRDVPNAFVGVISDEGIKLLKIL